MQFSELFASAGALAIPVLALAGVLSGQRAAQRVEEAKVIGRLTANPVVRAYANVEVMKRGRATTGWYALQGLNTLAEFVCLVALAAPGRYAPNSLAAWAATIVTTAAIIASFMALIMVPATRPTASEEPK